MKNYSNNENKLPHDCYTRTGEGKILYSYVFAVVIVIFFVVSSLTTMTVLSVPNVTANMYCICLSIPQIYT